MKKTITTLLGISSLFISLQATAGSFIDGISLATGKGRSGTESNRLSFIKDIHPDWLDSVSPRLGMYLDASINDWHNHGDHQQAYAISPVWTWQLSPMGSWQPRLDAGVGLTLVTANHIGTRQLGSDYHFEDRIGVLLQNKQVEIGLHAFHYSNAGLKQPNEGVDLWMVNVTWRF